MKVTKGKKSIEKKENPEDEFRTMLESYTVVPPSPLTIKKIRKTEKKHKKASSKK